MRRTIRKILAVAAAGSAFAPGAPALAQEQLEYKLEIERAPLRAALTEFSEQTGTYVSFLAKSSDQASLLVGPIEGRYTAESALDQIIVGSGLTYTRTDATHIAIIAKDTAPIKLARLDAEPRTARVASAASSGRSAESSKDSQSASLEEVIVTAQKREERLQDVPVSISVLGGEDLDRSTLQGISETLGRVPGIATPVALQGGGTQLSVRGVSAASPVFTGSSPIAYYLDTVPFALVKTAIAPDVDAYDLERVEVLRGPQGTLYGAGSLNGVVRVLTKDADPGNFEIKGRALISNTDRGGQNARGDMAVNVPLVADKLAARAVLSYGDLSGWIDKPNERDSNDAQLLNMRVKVNAQPTEQLSLGLSAWSSRADYGAPSFSGDGRTYPTMLDESIATDYDVYGLKIGYDFSAFALTSATSYLDYVSDSFLDQTVTGIPGYHLQTRFSAKTLAQEVNLTSTHGGSWRWTVGGLYRDSEDQTFQNGNFFFVVPQKDVFHSKSYAVFGELTRSFLEGRVELTGGLRYFEDRLIEKEESHFTGTPAAGVYGRATFDAVSPRVVLNWKPDESVTLYASYSEGFRSGAHHSPAIVAANPNFRPTEPDTLHNYEIGTKGNFADGKLAVEAAVFYIDWSDVQQSLRVPITDAVILSTLVNSNSASGMGFEFGLTGRAAAGLVLGANFSWNDLAFDSNVFSNSVIMFHKGDRLNFSPEYTAGASADYTFYMGQRGYEGTFSTGVNYTSELRSRRLSGTLLQISDGDSMVVGRVSFSVDSPSRWTATLFVDNVNNEDGAFVNDWLGVAARDMRMRRRTAGLEVDYRF